MIIEDLIGTYNIIGTNQDASNNTYKGILTLTLDTDIILAKWWINNEQEQVGTGFLKDNILTINFSYLGEDNLTFTGEVVYRCISNELLDGIWSETYGDPLYVGTERCFRIKQHEELLN